MKQIQSVRLTFTAGTSDKEYRIHLIEDKGSFTVNFEYGRRNGTLKSGTKTNFPVSQEEAEKIFNKILKEKTSEGYILDGESMPSLTVAVPKTKDATVVQLLQEIKDDSELEKMIKDPNYVMQKKQDGDRRTLDKAGKEISGGNKKAEKVGLSQLVIDSVSEKDIELDGESVGETIFVFDILRLNKKDLRKLPYEKRLSTLETLSFGKNIKVVETAHTESEKRAMMKKLKDSNAEGFVLKEKNSSYNVGREGSSAYKYKFYKTATVKVVSITKGKRSVQMAVSENSNFVEVGSVTIPPNKEVPKVGEFIEVRYLYAYKGGALYQPTFLFKRTDVDDSDCVVSQLEYKKDT